MNRIVFNHLFSFIKNRNNKLFLFIVSVLVVLTGCNKENIQLPTPKNLPELTIHDIEIERTNKQESGRFFIQLNKVASSNVSFNYTLSDGSAKENIDYIFSSGTIIIPQGQSTSNIEIFVTANIKRQPNITFDINLSSPTGVVLKNSSAKCTIITINGETLETPNIGYIGENSYPGMSLVWSDEFNTNELDQSQWNQEIGNGEGGWGNSELQYYTSSKKNTFVSNGNLIVEARKEDISGFQYSSGRLTTKGKREFKYGRIDIRAKLPKGKGIWPALWMLGANINTVGWPACGEIDIMELIGSEANKVHGTLHWKGTNGHVYKGGSLTLTNGDFSQEFHVYSLIWEEDNIQWLVDDKIFYKIQKSDFGSANYPFNADQFFIINLAVGGNWPGVPDSNTIFPQRLFVDYIRIFQ